MTDKSNKVIAGLEDCLAHARGEKGRAHVSRITTPAQTLDRPCRTVEQAAIARLRKMLREAEEVLASKDLEAVFALAHTHGYRYGGPVLSLKNLRALLRDTAHLDPSTKPADPSEGEG